MRHVLHMEFETEWGPELSLECVDHDGVTCDAATWWSECGIELLWNAPSRPFPVDPRFPVPVAFTFSEVESDTLDVWGESGPAVVFDDRWDPHTEPEKSSESG